MGPATRIVRAILPGLMRAALLAIAPFFLHADEIDGGSATQLLRKGEILPLSDVLARVRRNMSETILEVEVERTDDGLAYEIFYLDAQGRRQVVFLSARTGAIIDNRAQQK